MEDTNYQLPTHLIKTLGLSDVSQYSNYTALTLHTDTAFQVHRTSLHVTCYLDDLQILVLKVVQDIKSACKDLGVPLASETGLLNQIDFSGNTTKQQVL